MSEPYNHKAIEKKWQEYWKEHETFKTDVWDFSKPKYYALDMSDAGSQVHFKAMRKLASEHPSEKVGEEIRKLYSWNDESDKLINN